MSLLDELDSLGEQGKKPDSETAAVDAEAFYCDHVKQRMVMAKDYFNKLFLKLNEVRLVVQVPYPFKPGEKPVTLMQQQYKAYTDDAIDPHKLVLGFTCVLSNPTAFDVGERGAALALSTLLDRYEFPYKKIEARQINKNNLNQNNTNQQYKNLLTQGARFKLQGPLQVKCMLEYDGDKQVIKLLLTHFNSPGTILYNLKPEQLDEAFIDHLGRYLIRKEAQLFDEQLISDDEKAELREKLAQEKQRQEAELLAAEKQRQAEEIARKQDTTTAQLKKAVKQSVTENSEKLKHAVTQSVAENTDKLKKVLIQSVAENSEKLKKVMDEKLRDKGEKLKSMFSKITHHADSVSGTVPTTQPENQQAEDLPEQQVIIPARKSVIPKEKHEQPKVFESSASNPFLTADDFVPVPMKQSEAETESPAENESITHDEAAQAEVQDALTPEPGSRGASAHDHVAAPLPDDTLDAVQDEIPPTIEDQPDK